MAAALGQTSALTVTPLTAGQRRAAYVAALSAAKQLAACERPPRPLLTAAVLALVLLGPLAVRRPPAPVPGRWLPMSRRHLLVILALAAGLSIALVSNARPAAPACATRSTARAASA